MRKVGGYNFDSKTELVDGNIMRLLSDILVAHELFFFPRTITDFKML